ncbi:MAG TPA: diguanylate cyclase [Firmicutes bacterium]|nr:diguanylate cyclase [Bacillota bacterium]
MRQKYKHQSGTGRSILLVDDSKEYLESTRRLLEREGHTVLTAASGAEALEIVKHERVDLMLVDYFMPGMTGEDVVHQVRKLRPYLQIIIQTGYAGEQPPRELLKRLDIQGYYDKSEGPEKLLLWVDAGLKSAYFIELLYKSRQGLKYILNITPDLHKIQSLQDLLKGVLLQISGLLGVVHSFLAVVPEKSPETEEDPDLTEGFLAMLENDLNLVVQAATGRFSRMKKVDLDHLDLENMREIRGALKEGTIQALESATVIPLLVGESRIGVIYLDYLVTDSQELELIQIFANQAAVAIQNTRLYQMATVDTVTGLFVRGFFEQCLIREVRAAFRAGCELSFIMLDLDGMKTINDTGGHQAGDEALALVGEVLQETTRSTDITCRYGGDEFAAILPNTNPEGAIVAAGRILTSLKNRKVEINGELMPLKCSIGISTLPKYALSLDDAPRPFPASYFQEMAGLLVKKADVELYRAKKKGGFQYSGPAVLPWQPFPREKEGDE